MRNKLNYLHFILVFIAVPFLMVSCSSDDLDSRYSSRPSIESVSPESAVPGEIITIHGTGFGTDPSNVRVQFNDIYATTVVSVADNQIEVEVPPGFSEQMVNVRVFVSDIATPVVDFYYGSFPYIKTITPSYFSNSPVFITGANFSSNIEENTVKFGETEVTVIEATSTSLKVLAPEVGTATDADVTVTKFGEVSNIRNIQVDADQQKIFSYNDWTTHTVRPGVIYKTSTMSLFGGSERRIHILDVTLDASNTLGIGVTPENTPASFKSTMAICEDYDAVVGINAGYFQLGTAAYKDPYIRIDGNTVELGDAEAISTHFTNAALLIHNNVASVRRLGMSGNTLNRVAEAIPVSEAENVIVSGPMVVTDGELGVVSPDNSHNTAITARTGLGVNADGNRVLMVVVDADNGSTGVSTPQLGKILQALGAINALNFDGGGSSTMYVKDQGTDGLVNIPSGDIRSVHSVIYVK